MNFQNYKNQIIYMKYTIIIFITSLIATSGSLYFSQVMGLYPCEYCWYQRIMMYPIVLISFIHILRKKPDYFLYSIFSFLGLILSGYHSYLQRASTDGLCDIGGCSAIVYTIGPLSIPNLAFIAFLIIFIVSLIAFKQK